jgi:hypothetical protein
MFRNNYIPITALRL